MAPADPELHRVAFRTLRRGHRNPFEDLSTPCPGAACLHATGQGHWKPSASGGCLLMATFHGELRVDSGDGVFRIAARRFLCLPAPHARQLEAARGSRWMALHLRQEWFHAITGLGGGRALPEPMLLPVCLPMDVPLVHSLATLLRCAPHPGDHAVGIAPVRAVLLAARASQHPTANWVERAYGRSERHRRGVVMRLLGARNRILNAPFAAHDLHTLATVARYSPSHFLRSFRDVFGMTPNEMLTAARLDLARDLLRDSTLAICEVAASVGYGSRHSLSRSLKRSGGTTASGFRLACGTA